MNKKKTSQPSLDKKNKELLKFLKEKGVKNIKWYIKSDLPGEAWCNFDKEKAELEIVFKNEEAIASHIISHELFHVRLFVNGYLSCKARCQEHGAMITILNDIFAHIIIAWDLNKLGYSIQKHEQPAIEGIINKLDEKISGLRDDCYKKMLLNIFYVRAKKMEVKDLKLKELEAYLKKNNLYEEEIISIILNHLPEPNCKKEDYNNLLKKCIEKLELNNLVEFDVF